MAHAIRKFKEAQTNYPRGRKIYRIEQTAQKRAINRSLKVRKRMELIFGEMMQICTEIKDPVSSKGLLVTVMNFFIKFYCPSKVCHRSRSPH